MKKIKINSTLFHTWPWISGNPSGAWSPIQIIASLDFFSICQLISSLKRPPFQSVIPKDPEERKAYLLSIPTPDDWSPRSSRFTLRTDENGPSSWAGNFWRSYSCLPLVPPRPWVRWHAHSEPLPDRIWGSLDRKTNSQLPWSKQLPWLLPHVFPHRDGEPMGWGSALFLLRVIFQYGWNSESLRNLNSTLSF